MGQLKLDERVMMAFLRNWAKYGSAEIIQDQLEKFHQIYKDWEQRQTSMESPPQMALAIRDEEVPTRRVESSSGSRKKS